MAKTSYKQTIKGSKSAAASYARQAKMLKGLIAARTKGRQNLTKQYDNARLRNENTRKSTVKDLLSGFSSAQEGYARSGKDAESTLGIAADSSRLNRAREGASAMAELSSMQAGETDRIKGMSASIRGMKANQDGGLNDYASAMTNINNSLGDLNSSVSTNISNALREQNTNDASAFGEYSAGRQQAYADLVDLYGQQGSAFEQMADAYSTKKSNTKSTGTKHIKTTQTDRTVATGLSKKAVKDAKKAFGNSELSADRLARVMGQKFTDPIMTIDNMNAAETDPTMRFNAAAMRENRSNADELSNAGTLRKLAGPEGSRLRKKDVA